MAWSRAFTDELRAQADIRAIVSDYVTLKKKGQNFFGRCPFHQEKTGSFTVNPQRQIFKCFGCGKGGDVFTFLMEIERCTFPEAVKTVADKTGVTLPREANEAETEERDRKRKDLLQLNTWALEFFQEQLNEAGDGRRALAYLDQREVSAETRRTFKLGYAPESWDALSTHLRKLGASRSQIEQSGLVTLKESGTGFYDKFRSRLMFPISDSQGRVVAFGGRIVGSGEPKYLNSPETSLYTKGQHLFGLNQTRDNIRRRTFAILVEGYLDFLIPFQSGIGNVVASLGTALTEQQARLLGRYTRKVIVNFDPDAAGANASKRSLETLIGEGFNVKVLSLPDNLDPDEFIRKRGVEAYSNQLKRSQPFLDFVVDQALVTHGTSSPGAKVETINAVLPYLKLVNDKIERAGQFERIADRLKIESRLIRDEFKRAVETRSTSIGKDAFRAAIAVKKCERRLLELILSSRRSRDLILDELREEDYKHLRTAELFRLIIDLAARGEETTYSNLAGAGLDREIVEELLPSLLVQENSPQTEDNEVVLLREARGNIYSIRSDSLAEKQQSLEHEINRAQREGNLTRVTQLSSEKLSLARRALELERSALV